MRETNFIQQNREKWKEFEDKFVSEKDPEKVSNLFIQITDDLSYSRTYYPNRSVKIYLNNLAQKVFQSIYKNKVRRRRRFASFWKDELPMRMYEARWQLLFTFCLFTISMFIGIFSSMHDPDFARYILGDSYVRMTEENIRSGDPMKVYKEMNQVDMFLSITFNNLRVSFFTMIFGIFFGLGTAYFIIYNGIMVGAFQYFFIERGLFQESFLAIWVHGALEISAIVIAGTAGFRLGRGFLFPGTYTRLQSFRVHGMQAVQIFLGITPIIALAAINESFLTRYTETPDAVRAIMIALEFMFMIFYFVWYPYSKSIKGFNIQRRSDEIPPDKPVEFNFNKIKSNGEVFSDGFSILRQFSGPLLKLILIVSLGYTTIYFWQIEKVDSFEHDLSLSSLSAYTEPTHDLLHLLNNDQGPALPLGPATLSLKWLMNVLALTLIAAFSLLLIQMAAKKEFIFSWQRFFLFLKKNGWYIFLCSAALHLINLPSSGFSRFLFFMLLPPVIFMITEIILHDRKSLANFAGWRVYGKNFVSILMLYIPMLLLSIMMLFLSHSGICLVNLEIVKWNFPFSETLYALIQNFTITFILVATVFLQIAMFVINLGILYFSYNEVATAEDLMQRIKNLGTKNTSVA